MSSDDNGSSVMGSVIDWSYTVQETSLSEVEISYIAPTYSPPRLSDDDCNSPQQTEEVHSICSAMEVNVDQQILTNVIPQNPPIIAQVQFSMLLKLLEWSARCVYSLKRKPVLVETVITINTHDFNLILGVLQKRYLQTSQLRCIRVSL